MAYSAALFKKIINLQLCIVSFFFIQFFFSTSVEYLGSLIHHNQIRVYGKGIIDAFVKLGLKTGNKVENQVGVPNWIKNNKNYCSSCLKGLFDTDGSIYLTSDKKRIAMNFKNNSRPLVESFKEMCEKLAIKTNKVYEGWTYSRGKRFKHYKIEMFKQDQIKQFTSIVNPEKWLNRKERFIEILKNKRSSWSSVFNSQ